MKNKLQRALSWLNRIPTPVTLLVVCILTYGVLAPWLGFYLDDWYIVWFNKMFGPARFLEFFKSDRPLFAYVYMVFVPIFKDSRVAWQLFAVFTRWLSVCSFWYLLRLLLPNRKQLVLAVTILFAVYPGFQFHWFSVMYSQVYFLYTIYFISYILMIRAIRGDRYKVWLLLASFICQLIGIAPMEYFYGLELARPVILFIIFAREAHGFRSTLKRTVLYWIPYLVIFAGFTVYRISNSQAYSYQISLLTQLKSNSVAALTALVSNLFWYLYNSTIQVWTNLVLIFKRNLFLSSSLLMLGLIVLGFVITYFALKEKGEADSTKNDTRAARNIIWLGLFMTLASMIPFVIAGFEINLDFPNNRYLLSLAPGIALTIVGLIFYLTRTNTQKFVLVALLAGLSIGSQFLAARSFLLYWNQQKDFLAELTWRAPGLKLGTALVTEDLNFSAYFSGSSLTAPLNLIYAPDNSSVQIPYLMYLSSSGQNAVMPDLIPDQPIKYYFRGFEFDGNTSTVLTFVMPNEGCLRILNSNDSVDEFWSSLRLSFWRDAISLSNTDTIIADPASPATLPTNLFGAVSTDQWCYYFEKADLARQLTHWDEVISLYDQADEKGFKPINVMEWIPLIDAYANTDQLSKAADLTLQLKIKDDPTRKIICNAWVNLENQLTGAVAKDQIENLLGQLQCKVAQ